MPFVYQGFTEDKSTNTLKFSLFYWRKGFKRDEDGGQIAIGVVIVSAPFGVNLKAAVLAATRAVPEANLALTLDELDEGR